MPTNKSQKKADNAAALTKASSPVMPVSPKYNTNGSGKSTSMSTSTSASASASKEELEFQFVQNFHKAVRTSNPKYDPSLHQQQQQLFIMSFDHPLKFAIDIGKGKSEGDDATDVIVSMGDGSKPWFKIARVEELLIVTSLKGEPFLMIKEITSDREGGLAMDLYRYSPLALASENANREHPREQKIARVSRKYYRKERKFRWRKSKYMLCIGHFVEVLEPYDTHYPPVTCHGCWPYVMNFTCPDSESENKNKNENENKNTENRDAKKQLEPASINVATIKKQRFRNNKWQMTVAAEQDVLLFLGIVCAFELLERKVDEYDGCC